MFKPTDAVVRAARDLIDLLHPLDAGDAGTRGRELDAELGRKRPDLTKVLLHLARSAQANGLELDGALAAAASRAGCAMLGKRHPGATIEVRVPPYAAVQIGFETGSRHTRGTPPNVVEMDAGTFLALATGHLGWEAARGRVRFSGAHAADTARAFPLV